MAEVGRCGLCCSLLVRLNAEDIKRIRLWGYKERFFVAKGPLLKRINGYCVFLEIKEGMATCTIYNDRPQKCREYVCVYPGEEDCRLKKHYSIVDIKQV
ncbi:MAG: YkgJ family cysteine cluster protein [Candidatus Woesearchaeota archaeon]